MIALRHEGGPGAPLLLTFHGTGGTERQFHAPGIRLLPGAHVVSPRGAVSENGALRFFRRTAEGVYDMEDLRHRTAEVADLIAAEARRTGAPRVAALGYSNGANILASVLFARPGLVGDAVLLHPLIPFEPPAADLAGTRVLVTAGRRDPICPAPLTERLVAALRDRGAAVEALWHEGGHEVAPAEWEAVAAFLAPLAAMVSARSATR
ncbi:alpha/beta hydrolase [Rubellimicrobium sp. CFH 75288]|uniref:alpha/beta hydrolase n=1 Tax=Rubellimicrobium sp. CFH 75288 TaxID=2697034 RepID=UPI0014128BA4|nr:alpha/beta hydrolase [Rubellimicrobium sp. CFH 75288]NAZ37527.1 alpha/beta hydrolase [Rubellimicrobium sp. CFH 75288]